MNFGMQDIQNIIYKQLVQGNANVTGGRGKFAKDTAKRIYELLESENMNIDMKTQARARGIEDKYLDFSERAGKALGFSVMPLDPVSIEAYQWIIEQESKGQTIEAFAEWARKEESKYMGKYRKEAGNIKNDWVRAFSRSNTLGGEDERF